MINLIDSKIKYWLLFVYQLILSILILFAVPNRYYGFSFANGVLLLWISIQKPVKYENAKYKAVNKKVYCYLSVFMFFGMCIPIFFSNLAEIRFQELIWLIYLELFSISDRMTEWIYHRKIRTEEN